VSGDAPRPGLLRRALAFEAGIWRSLHRWVRRRPDVDDAEPHPYAGSLTPVLWGFIGVAAVEIPALHLLLPWPAVRPVALVLGGWGLVWMVGMLAALKVPPHTVGRPGLRIRHGFAVDLTVPWEAVAAVRYRTRSVEGMRTVQVAGTGAGRALSVVVGSQTNVDVVLRRPLRFAVPRAADEPVTEVRLFADDARALVARLRAGPERSRPTDARDEAR